MRFKFFCQTDQSKFRGKVMMFRINAEKRVIMFRINAE